MRTEYVRQNGANNNILFLVPSLLCTQYLESKSRRPLGELDVLGVVRAVSTSKVDATELRRL